MRRSSQTRARAGLLVGPVLALGLLTGCADERDAPAADPPQVASEPTPTATTAAPRPERSTQPPEPTAAADPRPPYEVSEGQPADARLSIPALGLDALEVRAYRGRTDDAPGTAIQNRGAGASPYGPRGGVGPGGVGNYQVTAHRNTAGGPFFALPDLERGQRVTVRAEGVAYVYEIVETRETSFRSERSLRAQRAAVPGRPGAEPHRAMITLSTCATQEDHAEGNYWADEFDNPEHRIDKVGVLVRTRRA